jgi:protein-S-isoprenylcysteine O-methyltransferase Ste14
MSDSPRLHETRKFHSRVFAVCIVALVLVSQPWLEADNILRELGFWLGYVLVIIGAMGRVCSSAYIGGRKNDLVMRAGLFSVVRNPLYVFSFIAVVGIGLQSGMFLVLILLAGAYILYYPQVVAKEEAFLQHKFGESYTAYLREVPRWIPNWRLWNEPEQTGAQPKFIRKTIMDAVTFFLPLPCFCLIAVLQMHHILPVWLTLP